MIWKKSFAVNHAKNVDFIIAAILIFGIVGLVIRNPLLLLLAGIFFTHILISKNYEQRLEKQLILENQKTKIKLFPGEETTVKLLFQNQSIYPVINGELQFRANPVIKSREDNNKNKNYWTVIKINASMLSRRKLVLEIPIIAEKRGTTRLHEITYTFPHLFLFNSITFAYSTNYQTEIIVFPEPKPVQGIETVFYNQSGLQRVPFSPIEDIQNPLGTRDYQYSDPFHRINWKASAKTQKLQTNVYERTADMSFVFIVNLTIKNKLDMAQFNENLETLLSYTAYLCQYALNNKFPYEVYINASKSGKTPYFHIPEGEGKGHYLQSLEMLSRIESQTMIVPINEMLYRIGQQITSPKTMIVIGEIPSDFAESIRLWKRRQGTIFHINNNEDGAYMKPWSEGVKRLAQ